MRDAKGGEFPAHGCFPTTQWSLVAVAGAAGDKGPAAEAARREALEALLRRYRPALQAHLISRRIRSDRADDLVQGFIADKLIAKDLLAQADRSRGRFRHFLQRALDNYAANQLRFDTAERRAPRGAKIVAIEETAQPPAGGSCNSEGYDMFDVEWARGVIAEALRRMREGCTASAREDLWDLFECRLLAPAIGRAKPLPYDEVVRRFGYDAPKDAQNALQTAKRRFQQALESVLREYVADEKELEEELRALGEVLSSAAAREASAWEAPPVGDEDSSPPGADPIGPPGTGG